MFRDAQEVKHIFLSFKVLGMKHPNQAMRSMMPVNWLDAVTVMRAPVGERNVISQPSPHVLVHQSQRWK